MKEENIASDLDAAEENPATQSTSLATDGTVSIAATILPPVTHQTFIANGNSSIVVFEIVSAKNIVIENAYFSGAYPLIQYISSEDIGVAVNQPSGQMGLLGVGKVDKQGIKLSLNVFYDTVDINTSGSVASLKITALTYQTEGGLYKSFNLSKAISAQPMCIVNNIPEILFKDPENETLQNGYKQIAKIELIGDIAWTLKALPLHLWSPYIRTITKSKLIIKSKGDKIAESDVIELGPNSRLETVINFEGGLKHAAGEKETLKIYAETPDLNTIGNPIITIMYPLSSFVWIDGLGVKLTGNKNISFYKEETGLSNYDEFS